MDIGFVKGSTLERLNDVQETPSQALASSSKQSKLNSYFDASDKPKLEVKRKKKAKGPTVKECRRVLREVFGHEDYRGEQKEIIESAIRGKDVFVVAPTGMGKSICFQVPAAAEKQGVTIVISPLLALMKSQVATLKEIGVFASAYTSETSEAEKEKIQLDLKSKNPSTRLLYITPETMCNTGFGGILMKIYERGQLNRLVVDEAHCISEWGHNFRGDYRKLGKFRESFSGVPIMALTASATPPVQDDIIENLHMEHENLYKVVHPFNRDNLFYEIRYISSPDRQVLMSDVQAFISALHTRRGRPSSGIVYCRNRVTCDELALHLRQRGISARAYHKGLKPRDLDKTLREWQEGGSGNGGVDVVCATIAFGMGIDKSDVRYIVHFDMPKSMEGYYQETGRAGRDGEPAKCVLYYSREDALAVGNLVKKDQQKRRERAIFGLLPEPSQRAPDSFGALVAMAENVDMCRHSICKYFGEDVNTDDPAVMTLYCDKMCDVCKNPAKTKRRRDTLSSEEWVLSQIEKLQIVPGEEEEDDDGGRRGTDDVDGFGWGDDLACGNDGDGDDAKDYGGRGSDGERKDDLGGCPTVTVNSSNLPKDRSSSSTRSSPAIATPKQAIAVSSSKPINRAISIPCARSAIPSAPSTGASNALKRPDPPQSTGGAAQVKKLKPAYYGPGRPTSSLFAGSSAFNKPFRTPFKTPFKDITTSNYKESAEQKKSPVPDINVDKEASKTAKGKERTMKGVDMDVDDDRPSSPVYLPEVDVDIDIAASTKKIPSAEREAGFKRLRLELHRSLLKDNSGETALKRIGIKTPLHEERSRILACVAKDLEQSALALSVSSEGYNSRLAEKAAASRLLRKADIWPLVDPGMAESARRGLSDELEEAREMVSLIRRISNAESTKALSQQSSRISDG